MYIYNVTEQRTRILDYKTKDKQYPLTNLCLITCIYICRRLWGVRWRAVSNRSVPRVPSWDGPEKVNYFRFFETNTPFKNRRATPSRRAMACWPKTGTFHTFLLGMTRKYVILGFGADTPFIKRRAIKRVTPRGALITISRMNTSQ